MVENDHWEPWRNVQHASERKWDKLGTRYVTFVNQRSRVVDIKQFVRDSDGRPFVVEATDGTFYVWSNILSIQ